jgi:hypothetical protein
MIQHDALAYPRLGARRVTPDGNQRLVIIADFPANEIADFLKRRAPGLRCLRT